MQISADQWLKRLVTIPRFAPLAGLLAVGILLGCSKTNAPAPGVSVGVVMVGTNVSGEVMVRADFTNGFSRPVLVGLRSIVQQQTNGAWVTNFNLLPQFLGLYGPGSQSSDAYLAAKGTVSTALSPLRVAPPFRLEFVCFPARSGIAGVWDHIVDKAAGWKDGGQHQTYRGEGFFVLSPEIGLKAKPGSAEKENGFSALLAPTACRPDLPKDPPPILLFKGTGTSPNDVKAVEAILKGGQLQYATADSEQLDHLSADQLRAYRLLIIPGGNYLTIGDRLSTNATAKVRQAVQEGMNYLGICAGGLLAGETGHNSLNLTPGVRFGFYAEVNRGIHKAAVAIAGVGSPALEHYWEDGPQFTGWGAVVAKYPDGTPAVVQGNSGKGWVILCGTHPEAPATWRRGMNFTTPVSADHAYALTLIEAALNETRLPQYEPR